LQGCYKVKAKKKPETLISNYPNEEEHETSSLKETLVQLFNGQKKRAKWWMVPLNQ
jgi:hypothetical protein